MSRVLRVPESDLSHIFSQLGNVSELLQNKNLYITGGTGLFGIWLLDFLDFLKKNGYKLGKVHVLSRSPSRFLKNRDHLLSNKSFIWHEGSMESFEMEKSEIHFAIHGAATSAYETFNSYNNLVKFRTNVLGVEKFIDSVVKNRIPRVLFLSSGSTYGSLSSNASKGLKEDSLLAPLTSDTGNSLGHAKRIGELLFFLRQGESGYSFSVARCFTFVGPFLPLNLHYAVGNFILNSLRNEKIIVKSGGSAVRSYMYLSDFIHWLLSILVYGDSGEIYNVGSNKQISILDLASLVSSIGRTEVMVLGREERAPYESPDFYFPDTKKVEDRLGLKTTTGIEEAISQTLKFFQSRNYLWNE